MGLIWASAMWYLCVITGSPEFQLVPGLLQYRGPHSLSIWAEAWLPPGFRLVAPAWDIIISTRPGPARVLFSTTPNRSLQAWLSVLQLKSNFQELIEMCRERYLDPLDLLFKAQRWGPIKRVSCPRTMGWAERIPKMTANGEWYTLGTWRRRSAVFWVWFVSQSTSVLKIVPQCDA